MLRRLLKLGALLALCGLATAQEPQPGTQPEPDPESEPATEELVQHAPQELGVQEGREALARTIAFLLKSQNADGSWATSVCDDINELGFAPDTYYAWQQAASALAVLALSRAPRNAEVDFQFVHGTQWLCGTRMAHRGSNWDVDSTWASLYGFAVLTEIAADERLSAVEYAEPLRRRALEYYADLEKRQTLDGGWAYYDNPPFTVKPTWATSFCTALVLPALVDARALGWPVDGDVIDRARTLVERCALPNGAYAYNFNLIPRSHGGTSIDQVPGSLGRIQVCQWALSRAGVERITSDLLAEGLDHFFVEHPYLDMVRMRPRPHEGWFANAGYFYFFGHYYASRVIELLPETEREPWSRKLRFHIAKTLTDEGSCSDFMSSRYQITAGTAFAALALASGLPAEEAGQAPHVTSADDHEADQ